MHILRAADVPDTQTGGMSRAMHSTGAVLRAAGHTVDYLFREQLRVPGPEGVRRFLVPLRLLQIIRQRSQAGCRYDVVELHEPLGAPCCFARRWGCRIPPIVLYSHGLEERGHRAELAYRRQKNLSITLKKRYSPLTVVWQAVYSLRRADHVICCNSDDIAHLALAGVARERLTRLPTGVAPEFLAVGEAMAEKDTPRSGLLFVGSWILRKGILDLAAAVSQVMRDDRTVHLTVAGCGCAPSAVWDCFPAADRDRICVIPTVNGNAALIRLYTEHAIFILPSYFEGQPSVMIEAAALGMALVTSDIAGMTDFIADNKEGLLVAVGDVQALTDAVQRLLSDPPLARRLGAVARLKAQTHTWEYGASLLLQAYQRSNHER